MKMFNRVLTYFKSLFNRILHNLNAKFIAKRTIHEVAPKVRTTSLPTDSPVNIEIPTGTQSKYISFKAGSRLVIGRRDVDFPDIEPDIDLEPFEAFKYGISRRHALMTCIDGAGIYLEDLNSSNGTFINGQQVKPGGFHHHIHDGDIPYSNLAQLFDGAALQLGKLVMTVYIADPTLYPETVQLRIGTSSDAFWKEYRVFWHALVMLAFANDWQPEQWVLSDGQELSASDILTMADALEAAVPKLPTFGTFGNTHVGGSEDRNPPLASPQYYLGGGVGINGYVRPFIAACRENVKPDDNILIC